MTAETLKPFITPQGVDNYSATTTLSVMTSRQQKTKFLTIALNVSALILTCVIAGFTIWNCVRCNNLETEVKALNRVVETMQKHLGIHYLNEAQDFEKEYSKALIDNPNTLIDDPTSMDDDADSDDDDDDDYDENARYDELVNKYNSYDDEDDDDDMDDATEDNDDNDDNLYVDFEKYIGSKKKTLRKERSISNALNELSISDVAHDAPELTTTASAAKDSIEKTPLELHNETKQRAYKSKLRSLSLGVDSRRRYIVGENMDRRRSPLRPHSQRRHRTVAVKSGDSLISAKTTAQLRMAAPPTPAAHFHLNRKVPNRFAAITVDSYSGDLYIGHPSWAHDNNNFDAYFRLENGVLTILEPGLYYVYAQVCYNNTHDQNGFVIFHGHKPFLQCLNTVPTNMPMKIHTCHTSGLIYLLENETIHLRDFHTDRNAILKDTNNRSYFGLIKI